MLLKVLPPFASKRRSGFAAVFGVVLSSVMALTATNANAQAGPIGVCDSTMYLSQGSGVAGSPTTLMRLNTAANPLLFPAVGSSSITYNAIGFNAVDGYIYGTKAASNILVKIGADGIPVEVGPVANLPAGTVQTPISYLQGEISPTGTLYVKTGNFNSGNELYAINIAAMTATKIGSAVSIGGSDMGWYQGFLYTLSAPGPNSATPQSINLYRIDPATGVPTLIGPTGFTTSTGTPVSFGALFGATNGLYANENGTRGFFKIDIATGAATLISSSPGAAQNDGAHCTSAPISFQSDLGVTKTDNSTVYTPGQNVTYSIVVTNYGPFGAQNIAVSDPLPSGTTAVSWSCAINAGAPVSTSCGETTSGTGAINVTGVDLPVAVVNGVANYGSVTYTYTVKPDATRTGNLVNTVTVSNPSSNSDPNPDTAHPNTATDTDVMAGSITINKIAVPKSLDDFAFTTTGTGLSAFTLDDDASVTGADNTFTNQKVFGNLVAGTYTVTETANANWNLTDLVCTGDTGGTPTTVDLVGRTATIGVDIGEKIVCTYTNTIKPAQIKLEKKSVGGIGGPFNFTLTNTLQTSGTATTVTEGTAVQVDGDTATSGLQSYTVATLGQAVTINESAIPADFAYDAVNSVCKDANGATVSTVSGSTLTIPASAITPDAKITCTVVNNKRATLTIKKTAVGGGNQFKFDVAGALTSTFYLDPTGGTGNVSSATQPAFVNVLPNADITITESKPTGATYSLIDLSCSDAAGAPTGSTLVTNTPVLVNTPLELGHITGQLAPGANVTCVFTNRRNVNGTVTKHTTGGDGTFTLQLRRGSTTGTLISTNDIITAGGQGTVTKLIASTGNDVPFTIQETNIPAGWVLTNATCTLVNAPAGVDGLSNVTFNPATNSISGLVDAGTEITCDFYNTRIPKITIAKESVGGTGTFTFGSGTNGLPSSLSITTTAQSPSVTTGATAYQVSSITADATITENANAGWAVTSAICRIGGATGATVPSALSGSTLTIPASTLAEGNDLTCIFKNEKQPVLTLTKTVINDNGVTATAGQWTLTATGPSTLSGTSGVSGPVAPGTYTLGEGSGPANYDPDPSGYRCSINGGATVADNSITLALGDTAACSITNNDSNKANVTVTKSNNSSAPLVSGTNTTYTISVSNAGPASAHNTVITETDKARLDCGAAGLPSITCSATGGASCPSSYNFTALKTGATIPLLPAGGNVTFALTCKVN